LQVARTYTRPKPAKELAYPIAQTEKFAAKMRERITKDKNGQLVTRAKSKRAVGGNLKGIATKIFCANLTVLCSEMPASS